jgi:hypothetical protein
MWGVKDEFLFTVGIVTSIGRTGDWVCAARQQEEGVGEICEQQLIEGLPGIVAGADEVFTGGGETCVLSAFDSGSGETKRAEDIIGGIHGGRCDGGGG